MLSQQLQKLPAVGTIKKYIKQCNLTIRSQKIIYALGEEYILMYSSPNGYKLDNLYIKSTMVSNHIVSNLDIAIEYIKVCNYFDMKTTL